MLSVKSRLDAQTGVGPGFDAVRLGLATAVLFIHSSLIGPADPTAAASPLVPFLPVPTWAFEAAVLPMFFALSGFLVAASAERLSLADFATNRALRIVPALAVEIVLSALVLGPLLTTLPLRDYIAGPDFARYFLNILGSIHYELPGVFKTNPATDYVNGSLWTVPHEITCYVVLAGCMVTGMFRRRGLLLAGTLALFGVAIAISWANAAGLPYPGQGPLTYAFVTRGAARLLPMFLAGLLLYRFRDRIPYGGGIAAGAAALYLGLTVVGTPAWAEHPLFNLIAAPLFAYLVVYAGLSPSLRLKGRSIGIVPIGLLAAGDYSYGIYLYGYPLQQTILHLVPGLASRAAFFALSLGAVSILAVFSWHVIERPILRLRRSKSVTARLHTEPAAESAPSQAYPAPAAAAG